MRTLRHVFFALAAALFAGQAAAQEVVDPSEDLFTPGLVAPTLDFTAPAETLNPPAPDAAVTFAPAALPPGPRHDLVLEARLVEDGEPVREGILWRVFSAELAEGHLPLLQEARGGTTTLELPAGDYLIHASFGRAGATKRVTIADDDQMESLILDAGGLKLDSMIGDDREIAPESLTMEVMQESESGELVTVVPNATPGRVVRLSAGTYHVISRYGGVNAVVRADIEVEAGKLTHATMRHAGAEVTLKLVSEAGGEALANTNWTVITQDGNTVHESIGAFPNLILAAGTYTAVAIHQEKIYSRDFTVEPGIERDIEVRLSDLVQPETGAANNFEVIGPPMEP